MTPVLTLRFPNPRGVDVVDVIADARRAAARVVNATMTTTYWFIGRRIIEKEQRGSARADYGEQLVKRLALDLSKQFGRGFSKRNLWQMRAFYLAWPIGIRDTKSWIQLSRRLPGFFWFGICPFGAALRRRGSPEDGAFEVRGQRP